MPDEAVSEQPSTDAPQSEVQERSREEAAEEFALLTLLHARLERGSDVELIYPLPTAPGLSA